MEKKKKKIVYFPQSIIDESQSKPSHHYLMGKKLENNILIVQELLAKEEVVHRKLQSDTIATLNFLPSRRNSSAIRPDQPFLNVHRRRGLSQSQHGLPLPSLHHLPSFHVHDGRLENGGSEPTTFIIYQQTSEKSYHLPSAYHETHQTVNEAPPLSTKEMINMLLKRAIPPSFRIPSVNGSDERRKKIKTQEFTHYLTKPRRPNTSHTLRHLLLRVYESAVSCVIAIVLFLLKAPIDMALSLEVSLNKYIFGSHGYFYCSLLHQGATRMEQMQRYTRDSAMEVHWLLDLLLGWVFSYGIRVYRVDGLYHHIRSFYTTFIHTPLGDHILWIMGNPAGLKLNAELNKKIGHFILECMNRWYLLLDWPFVQRLYVLGIHFLMVVGSMGGLSFMMALLADFGSVISCPLSLLYVSLTILFNVLGRLIYSLCFMFTGTKWNCLRERRDSAVYAYDHMLLATVFLTLLLFLFPTMFCYYVSFFFIQLILITFQHLLFLSIDLLNEFPTHAFLFPRITSAYLETQHPTTPLDDLFILKYKYQSRLHIFINMNVFSLANAKYTPRHVLSCFIKGISLMRETSFNSRVK